MAFITDILEASSITGSLLGTASFASTSQTTISASYANTANTAVSSNTASYVNAANVDGIVAFAATSSYLPSYSEYNGNRAVTNSNFPAGIYNNNFGTTGSLSEFINAVFFPGAPNSAPVITSVSFSINEYQPSGSTVGTVVASDPESNPLTFSSQSSYTLDEFRISPAGVITANVLITASLNTNSSQGYPAAPFPIQVTDGSNTTVKTLYIAVNPNTAPTFRQGSVNGSIITSFTSSLNESSISGSKGVIYFTDSENNTITVTAGSITPSGYFALQISSSDSLVRIVQTTASINGATGSYTFSLTASDQYYPSPNPNGVTYLSGLISVADNAAPSINNQTLTGVTESAAAGTSAGVVAVTEPEGDVVTFVRFNLSGLLLDGSPVPTGSYTGTSHTNPTENPFQINSSTGEVTIKNGVFLNSDLINAYEYNVGVVDNFNATTGSGVVTIPVADDAIPSINPNGTFYIIESATSGSLVRISTDGYSGTQAGFTSNQSPITWAISSSNLFAVNSSGQISLTGNISGTFTTGNVITGSITASNSFGTTNAVPFYTAVTINQAPVLTINPTAANLTASLSVSGSNLLSITSSDPQGIDNILSVTLSGGNSNKFNLIETTTPPATTRAFLVQPTASLTAGNYNITASTVDSYGNVTLASSSFVIVPSVIEPSVYVYASSLGQTAPIPTNYNAILASVTRSFNSGTLGAETITISTSKMTLIGSGSTSELANLLGYAGTIGNVNPTENVIGNNLIYIVYPSSSQLTGRPSSMGSSFGGSTLGQYLLYYDAGGTDKGVVGSQLNDFTLTAPGYTSSEGTIRNDQTRWTVLGCNNSKFSAASVRFYVLPTSGSAPA